MSEKTKIVSKQYVCDLFNVVSNLPTNNNIELKYFKAKVLNVLRPEFEIIKELSETQIDKFKEYTQKLFQLVSKYSLLDEQNNLKMTSDGLGFQLRPEVTEVEKQHLVDCIQELNEEYKEEIQKRNEEVKSLNDILKTTIELDLPTIKLKNIPNSISDQEMNLLLLVIDED